MATFRKAPSGKWRAEIWVGGVRKGKSFVSKREAVAWSLKAEDAVRSGSFASTRTFRDVLEEYRQTVTPTKRGAVFEDRRIRFYKKDAIARYRLSDLSVSLFEGFARRRLGTVSGRTGVPVTRGTLVRDLNIFSAVLHWCVRRGYVKDYPLAGFRWPTPEPHRERVASDEEIEKLCFVAGWDRQSPPATKTQATAAAFVFSCLTGMRAGEIVALERSWISGCVLRIPATVTKTAQAREIPLSADALALLELVMSAGNSPEVFGLNLHTREALWNKIRNAAGLGPVRDSAGRIVEEGLRFHDGRATFCTRAAEKISVLDLARITGHRDLKMLMKYYRPTAEEIARKL